MKSLKSYVTVALLGVCLAFISCGDDPPPATTAQDDQLTKLSKTWTAKTVTYQDIDQSTAYKNFTLTISGTNGQEPFDYSTTGRPSTSPWAASGKFTFSPTDFATVAIRDDNDLLVTYSVTDTKLEMNFTYDGAGFAGRTGNVKGIWVFRME